MFEDRQRWIWSMEYDEFSATAEAEMGQEGDENETIHHGEVEWSDADEWWIDYRSPHMYYDADEAFGYHDPAWDG